MNTETQTTCLVLGGSGYIGAEVCRKLVATGARVAFTYCNNASMAQELAAETGAIALHLDLRDFASVAATVAQAARELGHLDALIQCAGIAGEPALYQQPGEGKRTFLGHISEAGWDDLMDITVKGSFAACQAAAPYLQQSAGQIVIVGAMDAVKSLPSPMHYAASKGALRSMVQALAQELGPDGVRVNLVAPGLLAGGMSQLLGQDVLDEYVRHCSLKRLGTAQEIAGWISWFARENSYINGQAILLDGGL